MADKKISQLLAATTPLAGTELLPIVQSGTTDNITINNLAAGNIKSNATTGVLQVTGPAAASTRVMTTPDANFTVARTDAAQTFTEDQTLSTGNLVIGTSGKGIDFSATASGSGTMTSELLADYEEGTFTPVVKDAAAGNAATTYASQGWYTKIGNRVYIDISLVNVNTTGLTSGNTIFITGLPYTHNATLYYTTPITISGTQLTTTTGSITGLVDANTAYMTLLNNTTTGQTNLTVGAINSTNSDFYISCNYATT